MNVTCIFFGIIFTIAGFMFACGEGHIHFSSWKNMPQEEKEKIIWYGGRTWHIHICMSIRNTVF